MSTIKNGTAYPKAVKSAALKATKLKANRNRSVSAIANDFGISAGTLSTWKRVAGLNKPQPAGLAAHHAAQAAIATYNTPTVVDYVTTNGLTAQCIQLRGKMYK